MTADEPTIRSAAPTRWHVLLPVKDAARAKSRLASALGARRPDVALAFASDALDAALCCPAVASVTVATSDEKVAAVLGAAGARVVDEGPVPELNRVIMAACSALPGSEDVAVLLGDLPAITPRDLEKALGLASEHATAFVPDAVGTGTTLLTASHVTLLQPHFGPGSASAHALSGAVRLVAPGLERMRCDVDNLADLRRAVRLGLGRHTRELLRDVDLWANAPEAAVPVVARAGNTRAGGDR